MERRPKSSEIEAAPGDLGVVMCGALWAVARKNVSRAVSRACRLALLCAECTGGASMPLDLPKA
jgi:hypothetical protein